MIMKWILLVVVVVFVNDDGDDDNGIALTRLGGARFSFEPDPTTECDAGNRQIVFIDFGTLSLFRFFFRFFLPSCPHTHTHSRIPIVIQFLSVSGVGPDPELFLLSPKRRRKIGKFCFAGRKLSFASFFADFFLFPESVHFGMG